MPEVTAIIVVVYGLILLLSFAHDFAKQDKTTQFDAGSKTAITQSILHGFAWYFLCTNANVFLIC